MKFFIHYNYQQNISKIIVLLTKYNHIIINNYKYNLRDTLFK